MHFPSGARSYLPAPRLCAAACGHRTRFRKPPSTSQDSPGRRAAGRWKPGLGGAPSRAPRTSSDSARCSQPRVSMPPVSLLAGGPAALNSDQPSEHLALCNVPHPHSQPLLGCRKTLGCRRRTWVGGAQEKPRRAGEKWERIHLIPCKECWDTEFSRGEY